MTTQANNLVEWLSSNGVVLAIVLIALFIVYRVARPAIHRLLEGVVRAQAATLGVDPGIRGQAAKRAATLEDVLARLLRVGVITALIVVILGIFDLWPLLTGLGLVAAAITLAGQSIVLDYLMGLLILIEGQYFIGDIIRVDNVEGTVTEVGFRRTVVLDRRGTVHSLSNGQIRRCANLTRMIAIAIVDVDGISDGDVEQVIQVITATGQDIAADPIFARQILEAPTFLGATTMTAGGVTLRFGGRVRPEHRRTVEAEMRRRVAAALAAAAIEPIRPGTAGPPDG